MQERVDGLLKRLNDSGLTLFHPKRYLLRRILDPIVSVKYIKDKKKNCCYVSIATYNYSHIVVFRSQKRFLMTMMNKLRLTDEQKSLRRFLCFKTYRGKTRKVKQCLSHNFLVSEKRTERDLDNL